MTVSRLVAQAQQSARAGRRDAAERAWKKVLDLDSRHTQALTALGNYALDRGDLKRALEYLETSRLTAPTDLNVLMALGSARRAAGDESGEIEAIQWALAVDPGFRPISSPIMYIGSGVATSRTRMPPLRGR